MIGALRVIIATHNTGGGGPVDPLIALFGANSGFYPIQPGYVFNDTAGTIPCTADGDLIKCSKPRYGNLPTLTQSVDSLCPIFKDDGGGLWRADFDGLDDELFSPNLSDAAVNATNLIADALMRSQETGGIYLGVIAGSTVYHRLQGASMGRLNGQIRNTNAYTNENIGAGPLVKLVSASVFDGANLEQYTDLAGDSTAASGVTVPFTGRIRVGGLGSAVSHWGVAVHRAPTISLADRTLIVKALAALQGRTL